MGLPLAKYLLVARALRRELPRAWLIGVGVSFSFVSGDIGRAPGWLQRLGLEWLHRLAQEPRRLFRRYVIEVFRSPCVCSSTRCWSVRHRRWRCVQTGSSRQTWR